MRRNHLTLTSHSRDNLTHPGSKSCVTTCSDSPDFKLLESNNVNQWNQKWFLELRGWKQREKSTKSKHRYCFWKQYLLWNKAGGKKKNTVGLNNSNHGSGQLNIPVTVNQHAHQQGQLWWVSFYDVKLSYGQSVHCTPNCFRLPLRTIRAIQL